MEKPAIGHETCQEQLDLEMARYTCVNTVRVDDHAHGVIECVKRRDDQNGKAWLAVMKRSSMSIMVVVMESPRRRSRGGSNAKTWAREVIQCVV